MSKDRRLPGKPKAGPPMTPKPRTAPPNSRLRLVILLGLLIALIVFAVFWWRRPGEVESDSVELLPPPEDPRVTFDTPYLNVRPTVRYVGDEACATCHKAIAKSYHQHPMGRSLAPVAEASAIERYDAEAHNPFDVPGLTYLVEKRDKRVIHKETAGPGVQAEAEIAYAVGSGRRGRSYIVDHDGYLFESPITWYPLKGIWDLSPGYRTNNPHFSRPIIAECLYCHANQVEPDVRAANWYKPPLFRGYAIGCERCHGPGELHVDRRRTGEHGEGVDFSIVNPRHLEHSLREAICQQCHLHSDARVLPRGREYFDFRPGLPLHLFLANFVQPVDRRQENQFTGTVEQMYVSRCFAKSSGPAKLGCTSCHDPHSLPTADERIGFYRNRCQSCHEEKPCSLPRKARLEKSPQDSCIVCHMPVLGGSIAHTAVTNHAIPRKPIQAAAPTKPEDWPRPNHMPLQLFPGKALDPNNADDSRNLGAALTLFARTRAGGDTGPMLGGMALPLLEKATMADPRDLVAWEERARALVLVGRFEEALAACVACLKLNPDREMVLLLAGGVAAKLQRNSEMLDFAKRAFAVNPWLPLCSQMLAEAYAREGQWKAAAEFCRTAVRLEPVDLTSRQFLIRCYLAFGDLAQARAELEACSVMLPPTDREGLRQWFEQQKAKSHVK